MAARAASRNTENTGPPSALLMTLSGVTNPYTSAERRRGLALGNGGGGVEGTVHAEIK
jgi:hypothetical protein